MQYVIQLEEKKYRAFKFWIITYYLMVRTIQCQMTDFKGQPYKLLWDCDSFPTGSEKDFR